MGQWYPKNVAWESVLKKTEVLYTYGKCQSTYNSQNSYKNLKYSQAEITHNIKRGFYSALTDRTIGIFSYNQCV